jgi:hypothetical protein
LCQLAKSRFTAAIDDKREHPVEESAQNELWLLQPAADTMRTRTWLMGYFPPLQVPWPDVIADAAGKLKDFFDVVSQANSAGCARIITASGLKLKSAGSFRAYTATVLWVAPASPRLALFKSLSRTH